MDMSTLVYPSGDALAQGRASITKQFCFTPA